MNASTYTSESVDLPVDCGSGMRDTRARRARRLDALVLSRVEVDDMNVSVDGAARLELPAPDVGVGAEDGEGVRGALQRGNREFRPGSGDHGGLGVKRKKKGVGVRRRGCYRNADR